jgi:hypothetical protein
MSFRQEFLKLIINLYPPMLGAGIQVKFLSREKKILVSMKLRFYNKNYVGTHYGGSLYSMCDGWFMVLLIDNLGREYIVWDKRASIVFKRPGKGTVRAEFFIPEERYQDIREKVSQEGRAQEEFSVDVKDEKGDIVASVTKIISIRKRERQ